MSQAMPELGSKISLISKADIRYEGRLFTVDPQECTIALASVRSFGTEERETNYRVPAQNQVYDYILFRGSDIKDIRVVNNVPHPQPLNDPAIMQLSVPPSLGGPPFQNHPVLGPMGPPMGQFGGAYGTIGVLGGLNPAMGPGLGIQVDTRGHSNTKPSELNILGPEPTPSVLTPTVEPPRPSNDHDLIGGSRSTTPASLGSRKSPTNDQGVQTGGNKRDDKKVVKPIQPPGQRVQQRRNSRERRDSRGDGQNQNRSGANRNHPNNHHMNYQNHQGQQARQGQGYHQNYQGHQNNQGNQRGTWVDRGPLRPRSRPRGGFRTNQSQPNQGNNKMKNTLKFENDYDFEQANTEFEELRSQLAKVKLEEAGSTSTKSEVNGDVDKKDDSGNETGAGEPEQEEEHEVFYDKSKSFFDKISCEAVERAKGKSQRTDWRVERKLNSETFGVAATRRGNYRGRGGYRGVGYRGGYRGNYRPPMRRDQQQQGNRSDQNQRQQTAQSNSSNTAKQAALPAQSNSSSTLKQSVTSQSNSSVKQGTIPEPVMAVK